MPALTATTRTKIIQWSESIILPFIFPLVGYFIDPSDPFLFQYQFSWLVLGPALVGLRYGFVHGLIATLLLVGAIALAFQLEWPQAFPFPKEEILGIVILTFISSEFHSYWNRKIEALEYSNSHIKARMEKFSRTHHLIRGSHYYLEQHLGNQIKSLRLALSDLRQKIAYLTKNQEAALPDIGSGILKIFSDYANVQIASIYLLDSRKEFITEPIAYIGKCFPLDLSDAIIKTALKTLHVTSVQLDSEEWDANSNVIVAVPLVDSYQNTWGIVTINEMPLFAMQSNTLDLFAILGGKIGDLLNKRTAAVLKGFNKKFIESKLQRVFKEVNLLQETAVIIALTMHDEELQNTLMRRFHAELRGTDEIWVASNQENRIKNFLLVLFLTNRKGAEVFLNRTEISNFSDHPIFLQSNEKFVEYYSKKIMGNMWVIDKKSSKNKILREIHQFCNGAPLKNKFIENESAHISSSI